MGGQKVSQPRQELGQHRASPRNMKLEQQNAPKQAVVKKPSELKVVTHQKHPGNLGVAARSPRNTAHLPSPN